MSLLNNYEHLHQLADELPAETIGEVRQLLSYAGEEVALVLGQGHPDQEVIADHVAQITSTCNLLVEQINALAEKLRSYIA